MCPARRSPSAAAPPARNRGHSDAWEAQAEVKAGNFAKAHELLGQAKQAQIAAAQQARELRQRAQEAEDEQLIQAAASSAAEADLSMTELHSMQAADVFSQAASTVPAGHEGERGKYLKAEANALSRQGDEFGDNAAALSATERYRHFAGLRPRNAFPHDWAKSQVGLGNALLSVGERESGTARLEEAVSACREALQERTPARVPLEWAMTQENLALVDRALFAKTGERVHLDDALEAVGGALEEYNKAKAAYDIEKAGRLRAELLAMKGNPKNRAAKNKP